MKATREQIKGALWGLITADALGVPVEFKTRSELQQNPVRTMTGYGTYEQPAGTWSDDSSMMLCTAESLLEGFDINLMAKLFLKWYKNAYWTPYDEVFDVGNTTAKSLNNLQNGIPPEKSGLEGAHENGNGSLMRILPLAFTLGGLSEKEKFSRIALASGITHRHIRSTIGCYIYIKYIELLVETGKPYEAYSRMKFEVSDFLKAENIDKNERKAYYRILKHDIYNYEEYDIESLGYVVYTLEAALWSFLNSSSYTETVLKAVNLGADTDTTAAVVGGIAGLFFGYSKIPPKWIDVLARKEDLSSFINKFAQKYGTE